MIEIIQSLEAYQSMLGQVKARKLLEPLGLARATRLAVLAALQADLQVPVVYITDRADHALANLDEIGFWAHQTYPKLFPEPNPLFYEQAAWGTTTRRDRLQALSALALYHVPGTAKPQIPPFIIATLRAVMARTLPRRDFIKNMRILKRGQQIRPESLRREWVGIGYQAAESVVEAGQFAQRGGILDIWPMAENQPVRFDFFGDEIESIRRFDPATQRTVQAVEQVMITPAREVLPSKAEEIGIDLQNLDEFHLPLVHPASASILDYLPQQALVVLDDQSLLSSAAMEIEEQSVRLRRDSIKEGTLREDFPLPYNTWSELQDSLTGHAWIDLGHPTETERSELAQCFEPGPRYGGRLKPFMEDLLQRCEGKESTIIVSRQVSRLKELWLERKAGYEPQVEPRFVEGMLTEGWNLRLPEGGKLHLFTDSEIFGWERPKPRQQPRPSTDTPEAIYADLKAGDWVVHVDYGIGRFQGLARRTLDATERDFLQVDYENGDQLYVPVHQADRLSRYIGPEGETPQATRLGTPEWSLTKQKVREGVLEVAQDLLELYARRQMAHGYSFRADTPWQQELEAAFPYVETVDQLRAIQEVKKDMENSRPMDRLLCGDVGYGKTEVALRAAFKAVMDGKQVAILVPTTVLAQQHYETFCQRLAPFPAVVEMLSRFRTPKEQDEILERLARGAVDIVIGTHRLISKDVEFKELGLVIIDEEQRFGVTHKEHLKKLRTEVDVLTLTATPIPRTLYMALTGVRDISTINTPPEERLPIVTHIGPYSPRLVRQSVLRELERGGQIFFVHNRVQTIRAMERHLNQLVPEARVGVGHGQMPEGALEDVMRRFNQAEIDILLCTSIIESGLDIPNANTLIVDRGDTFGLAQLYQLRGRVGRSAQRAYAYFFRHRKKPPTPEGQERLEVIAENTQLGSGYSIAMRDLEMRGAGELLGTRQHGYIAAVGFQLYTRLLAQAVRHLRQMTGLKGPEKSLAELKDITQPVNVDLPIPIGIPKEYVADQNMRLRLYRRIANLNDETEIQTIKDEFTDRFGAIPQDLANLLYQVKVKLKAEAAGLAGIVVEGEQIVLRYPPLPDSIPQRALKSSGGLARAGRNAYWMPVDLENSDWQFRLLDLLEVIL